jgi:hypothetical protein
MLFAMPESYALSHVIITPKCRLFSIGRMLAQALDSGSLTLRWLGHASNYYTTKGLRI